MAVLPRKLWLFNLVAVLPGILAGVHEQLSAIPAGWTEVGPGAKTSLSRFTIALNRDFERLEEHLLNVSTPGRPNYGKFLTREQADALFPQSTQATLRVTSWLEERGISNYTVEGDFIDFQANIEAVNQAFGSAYQYYRHDNTVKLRTVQYSIPDDVQPHIAFIDPGTFFGHSSFPPRRRVLKPKHSHADEPSKIVVEASCQEAITPACLRQMYNVGDYQPDLASGSTLGFCSFLNQSALHADLTQFEDRYGIPAQNFTKFDIENPKQDPTGAFNEANLDVQIMVGIAHPLPVTEIIVGGSPPFVPTLTMRTVAENDNEPYVPFLRYMLSKENADIPRVLSISYGDLEDSVPFAYAKLTCNLIGLLGLRGITVLAASGDGGLGMLCLAADLKTVQFDRMFPASCPYLTAVGGTSGVAPETAWELSSGGFSGYFGQPAYQARTVQKYLASIPADTRRYYGRYTNFSGRAYPDVAAHSLTPDFLVVYGGELAQAGGTSASAPLMASVVALLNDVRLRAGKSALGWLNPLIYGREGEGFTDITRGFTVGCQNRESRAGWVRWAMWNCTKGWDAATGFGTPDFGRLRDVVLRI